MRCVCDVYDLNQQQRLICNFAQIDIYSGLWQNYGKPSIWRIEKNSFIAVKRTSKNHRERSRISLTRVKLGSHIQEAYLNLSDKLLRFPLLKLANATINFTMLTTRAPNTLSLRAIRRIARKGSGKLPLHCFSGPPRTGANKQHLLSIWTKAVVFQQRGSASSPFKNLTFKRH